MQVIDDKVKPVLTHNWKRWIAESKMLGVHDHRLFDILKANGFDDSVISEELYNITSHPYYQAGYWVAHRLRKLESLLCVYTQLGHLVDSNAQIERRMPMPRNEFLERYYSANRPVVLVNLMCNWKAIELWDPQYLKATCGDQPVEVMTGRDSDPRYEVNSALHKTTMLFRQYIDIITRPGESNDCYMVANNRFMESPAARSLYDDIDTFSEYLDGDKTTGHVFLWFGSAGTVTPLHHDIMNVLIAQVRGRKRVGLISPDYTPRLYNDIGVYSEVDYEVPDFVKHPLFKDIEHLNLELSPGEVLFVPVGWWHYVRSLDVSVTISFTNFVFANQYQWQNPHIDR